MLASLRLRERPEARGRFEVIAEVGLGTHRNAPLGCHILSLAPFPDIPVEPDLRKLVLCTPESQVWNR